MPGRKGDLIDLLAVLLKYRRFLFWNTLAVTLLVLIFSFTLPVRYRATATLLFPKEESQDLLGLTALVQQFDIARQALTGPGSNAQVYMAILKSRTLADAVIEEFGLRERYRAKNAEAARRRFKALSQFKLSSSGVIEVSVEDTDRETAADLANSVVAHLDRLNRTLRMTEGKRTRLFIGERLEETGLRLKAAEDSLRRFQETHPGVSLPPSAAASATAGAQLMGERIALGVELDVLRTSLHPQAPPLLRKESELRALDAELENYPSLGMEIARRFREVKVQEAVYELLTARYEEARVRESKDVATIEVLDSAIPPVRKSFPRRGILSLVAMFLSVAVGLLVVAFRETAFRLRPAEDPRIRAHVRPGTWLDRVLFGRGGRATP